MQRICSLVALICFSGCALTDELSLQVAKEHALPVKRALGGMGFQLVYQDQLLAAPVRQEVLTLPIPVQRIPSGTQAMYFDWETGQFHGKASMFEGQRKVANLPLADYFDLAHQLGADVSYVVNVYQDTPEKTRRLAETAKSKGYPIRYWELGNEAAADLYSDKFANVTDYLAAARAHAAAIRSVFPDAQTAVATMNRDFESSPWNRALAAQNEFENIVVHRYTGPQANRNERQKMARAGEQVDVAGQMNKLLAHSNPDRLSYEDLFPGKHFWVTEWGLLYTQMDIQNSMAHALWMARTFIQYLRHPEVEMACYFNMNAAPFEIIAAQDGKVVHRVPFYVYQLMLRVLAGYTSTAPVRLDGNAGRLSDQIVGQYFSAPDGHSALLLVNASGRAHEMRVSDRERSLVIDTLGSESADASNGHSMALTSALRTKTSEDVAPEHVELRGAKVMLPPFGVVLVQMN